MADDDSRERLVFLVKVPPASWELAAEIADAVLANPDVVLRALGGIDKTGDGVWWMLPKAERGQG